MTTSVNRLIADIKHLTTEIEKEDYFYGSREDKCKLIRALLDLIEAQQ